MSLRSEVVLGLIGGLVITNITCFTIMANNDANQEESNVKPIERKINKDLEV